MRRQRCTSFTSVTWRAPGYPQPLTIQPQVLILQPGPAERAKVFRSAALRIGVQGVLDFTSGVAEIAEDQDALQQDAEERQAEPRVTPP